MSIELSKEEDVATLETNEKSEILIAEAGKNNKEFVTEILSKIENEINSETTAENEIKKIDSSVMLANPVTYEEIKKEIDLEKKLNIFEKEEKKVADKSKSKIAEIQEEVLNTNPSISGKSTEEIAKIFSNEKEQSDLLKSTADMFRKRVKLTEEEKKDREALLKFVETNLSIFEKVIKTNDPDNVSNCLVLYASLVNNGNELQQKEGMALLKNHMDLVKIVATKYEKKNDYESNAFLLRRSILEKGDKDVKTEARKWFEEMVNNDEFNDDVIYNLHRTYGKEEKSMANLAKVYMEKHGLPADKLLKYWKSAKIKPVFGFASIKKLEDAVPGAAKVLHQEFNISDFRRYPTDVMVDQYNNRNNTEMPYGIVMFPTADHNGAFNQDTHIIKKLFDDTKGKYLIRIMEAEGKFSLARNLISLNKRYGSKHKISYALLGGHGSKNSIQFGTDNLKNFFNEKNYVNKKDFEGEGVKRVKTFFEEKPQIVLVSCSTGKEGGIGQEISETYDADLSAPDRPAALAALETSFDQNGKIKFDASYYHSGVTKKYSQGLKK